MDNGDTSMQSYIPFEEANPLPDLSDILLSNETFCDIDASKKFSSDFIHKGAVCQIVGSCSSGSYTAPLSANQDNEQYGGLNFSLYNTQQSASSTILECQETTTEEEFLHQFNLSKCDKTTTDDKNVTINKKPNTRSFMKMKVAKRTHTKLLCDGDKRKVKTTLKVKIANLKASSRNQPSISKLFIKAAGSSRKEETSKFAQPETTKENKRMLEGSLDISEGGCAICHVTYSSDEHRDTHLIDAEHIIKSEVLKGTNSDDLLAEEDLFIGTRSGHCPECEKLFKKRRELLVHHRRAHSNFRPYSCVRCDMSFFRRCDLIQHLRGHLGANAHKCSVCSATFKRHENLLSHMIGKHGRVDDRERKFNCTECDESFLTKHAVDCHMTLHNGHRPMVCLVCGHRFRTNFALLAHQRTHSGEKPFKCDECSHSTTTKQLLLRHKRTHTGAKPFRCEICSYESANISCLKRHQLVHTGMKPFKCPYCPHRCSNIENLRKHIKKTKKHVGLKIYPCKHCTFSTDQCSEFLKHTKQLHLTDATEDSAAKLCGILATHDAPLPLDSSPSNQETATKDRMTSRTNPLVRDSCDTSTIDMLMSDQEMFPSQPNVRGHDVIDDTSEAMNGLDAELLNALIKIPNLQKVILPQVGDGNGPVTLVIGDDRTEEHEGVKQNEQSSHYDVIDRSNLRQIGTIASVDTSSSARQRFIISSSGIRPFFPS